MHSHYRIWYDRMIFIEIKSAVTIELENIQAEINRLQHSSDACADLPPETVTLQLKDS